MSKSSTDRLRVDLSTRRITLVQEGREDEWRVDEVRKASRAYGRAWSIVFLDSARSIARAKMTSATGQVLWWCIGNLHPRDWTLARHETIAAELGLTRSSVTKSLVDLRARGLVQSGDRSMLRLTIYLGWQGTAQAYQKGARQRRDEIEAGRYWHRENAAGEDGGGAGTWRIADDASEGTGPRERAKGAKRGGDAKAIGDIVARLTGRPIGGGDGE